MSDHDASAPLLPQSRDGGGASRRSSSALGSRLARHVSRCRRTGRQLLASRRKHFLVMAVVTLDVAALLANVFIQLIACEMHQRDEPWVQRLTEGLETAALLFSSLFMVELAACLFSFGFGYAAYLHTRMRLILRLADPEDVAISRTGSTSSTPPSSSSASSSTLAPAASPSPSAPSSWSSVCGAWPRSQKKSSWARRRGWRSWSSRWRSWRPKTCIYARSWESIRTSILGMNKEAGPWRVSLYIDLSVCLRAMDLHGQCGDFRGSCKTTAHHLRLR